MEKSPATPETSTRPDQTVTRRRWLAVVAGMGGIATAFLNTGCETSGGYQTRKQRGQPRPEQQMIRRRSRY